MFITTSGSVTGDAVIRIEPFTQEQKDKVGEMGKSWVATLCVYANAATLIPLVQLFLDMDALDRLVLEGTAAQHEVLEGRHGFTTDPESEMAP